ncbi:MAG TPA: GNAT family N-acetyltransferase [Pyrinomonadaceae bacterium]|nr:GNAT family N-acetyltransferase [Pyrinomonadaceae bacterium]
MDYRPISPGDYAEVRRFLNIVGRGHRVGDAVCFRALKEKTDRTVVAFDGGCVVGFARALTDGVSNGYISMVAVASECRGRGVGRELVERLVGEDAGVTWVLRAGRGSAGFWERLGFKPSEIAMEKVRTPSQAEDDEAARAGAAIESEATAT